MPSQTFQHAAVADAPVDRVWEALDRPATWESIPGVDRVIDPVIDEEGRLRGFAFETAVAGKTYRGEATPAGREELSLIAWDIDTSELHGSVMVGLSVFGEGTRVYVRLDLKSAGVLSALFFPAIVSALGDGFTTAVEDFAAGLGV